MRPDDFVKLLNRQPFRPFRIHLSTGLTFEIRHPELAVVERSLVWLHTPAAHLPLPLAERRLFVVLLHIVHGEFLEPAVAPSNN